MITTNPINQAIDITCITEYGNANISATDFTLRGGEVFFIENVGITSINIAVTMYYSGKTAVVPIRVGRAPYLVTKIAHDAAIIDGTLKYFR